MSAWSRQRQAIIVTYIILIAMIVAAVVYFLFIYNPPSCFDGTQNGLEEGIDCGGGCQLVCPFSASQPNVAWARAFLVAPGVYNLAAQVENPNFDVGATVEYVFRSYNADNVLIAEVNNTVTLYPTEKRVIFEPAVQTGNRIISRTVFEFVGNDGWYTTTPDNKNIITQNYQLDNVDQTPSLVVDLRNTYIRPVQDLIVSVVLYDANENIQQVSQTYVESIPADSVGQAFFSWRRPFQETIQTIDVFVQEPRTE